MAGSALCRQEFPPDAGIHRGGGEDIALWSESQVTLTIDGEAERVTTEFAGVRYLPTLGIRPALGRNFVEEEDKTPGAAGRAGRSSRDAPRGVGSARQNMGKHSEK